MKKIKSSVQYFEPTVLVLERGEELLQSLTSFAAEMKLKSAWLSGLGGAGSMTLGFYDLATKEYKWRAFTEPMEILSLQGNLSLVEGKPFWHVHGTFSGPDYLAVGGHIKELTIGLTGELFITSLAAPLTREFDETTGLKLICPLT